MPNAASNLVTKVCQKVKYATEYMLGTVSTKIRKMADIWESKSCGSCLFPSNNRILSTTTRKAKMKDGHNVTFCNQLHNAEHGFKLLRCITGGT